MTAPFREYRLVLVAIAAIVAGSSSGAGANGEIGFTQRPGEQIPLEIVLQDERGQSVRLAELFGAKPVILMPVYYRCPMLCGLELNGLLRCLRGMELSAGQEFLVVTYSIDAREGPDLARQKRDHFLAQYQRPGASEGWRFLTGDESSLRRLNDAIGFRARFDADSGQFAHAAGIVVCTPGGRVARYLFGVEFAPRDLRLSIVEASENRIGTITDQIMLYCYLYDPTRGKYGLAILQLLRIAGISTGLLLAGSILWMLRRERRLVNAPIS